jgi:peptide/nickel transport system ATP-binding protein
MSNLNPVWKIGSQVAEALSANGRARGAEAKRQAAQLLTEAGLGDSERRMKQYPHEFSGGMRQRTLIAIGLAARPKLLIADEPTSALDVTVQRQILDHLEGLTAELGTAVLLITHDLGLAAERAEHLVVMYRGQVVESGPARKILTDPQHPYTRRLVASAPSLVARRSETGAARAEVVERSEQAAEAALLDGGATVAGGSVGAGPAGDDVLTIENLTKVYKIRGAGRKAGEFKAVDDVSFSVRRGTTTAVVGESGSGKSTLAQMVLRLQEPTSGRVLFDGADVTGFDRKTQFAFRRRVQPIFQNPYGSLDPTYSIYRSIEEPLRLHNVGDKRSREATVRELLDRVSLPASVMRRFPNELSGGQRQRIAIARALALRPEVVVCDEAVSALDVLVQAQILDLLSELQADLGLTYLFITHDLAVVRQIADQVCVMQTGKLVEVADTDTVFESPQQEYTQALLNAIPGASLATSVVEAGARPAGG